MTKIEQLEKQLNAAKKEDRLEALKQLIALEGTGEAEKPKSGGSVNNHIHTIYSFSPYSPTAALYFARKAGLVTAGIMDHDSVGGCAEFVAAGEIANMQVTTGFECRVKMNGTPLNGKRINNPDQISVAYVAVHGIPHQMFSECEKFLKPFRENRNLRNRKMTEKINEIVSAYGLSLDFDKDVVPLSQSADGGSITERHILCGLAGNILAKFGKGQKTVDFIKNDLKFPLSSKIEGFLAEETNSHYIYDLIGALKSDFVAQFYIEAVDECPDVKEYISFVKSIGAVSAYAYLGDVGNSATGDKKTQKFEDDYINLLFETISSLGFQAVTYMPSRNTLEQLKKIMSLCDKFGFFQISGEDINTSRQSFLCPALEKPEFAHLGTATWVLIGHEKAATADLEDNMFSDKIKSKYPTIAERIPYFETIGKSK